MRENDAGTNGVMPEAENAWFFSRSLVDVYDHKRKIFFIFFICQTVV